MIARRCGPVHARPGNRTLIRQRALEMRPPLPGPATTYGRRARHRVLALTAGRPADSHIGNADAGGGDGLLRERGSDAGGRAAPGGAGVPRPDRERLADADAAPARRRGAGALDAVRARRAL